MRSREPPSLLIIGRGRLGLSLGRALRAGGVRVTTWPGRGVWPRRAPRVEGALLAVPDAAIEEVGLRLARRFARDGRRLVLLHASGARPAGILPGRVGIARGVLHPLVSFAGRSASTLAGSAFLLGGDRAAVAFSRRLVAAVDARAIARPIHGARYHAAAALLANGAAALAAVSVEIFVDLGLSRRAAERALGGLLRSVADNVAALGLPRALTGPVSRGDATTVAMHRDALARDRAALAAYDAVAPSILATARAAGLAPGPARRVAAALRAQPHKK